MAMTKIPVWDFESGEIVELEIENEDLRAMEEAERRQKEQGEARRAEEHEKIWLASLRNED